jgi:hypothetical protein
MKKAKIFLVVQSFICILTVIMLSTAAIGVYREGSALRAEDPTAYIYTPERTASEAAPGVKVLFIGIALTICGLIFGIRDENAEKPVKDTECMRDVTCSRITEPSIEMMNERRLQDKLKKGGWLAFGVCMLPILIYIADPEHFADASHDGLEHVIGALMLHILPLYSRKRV